MLSASHGVVVDFAELSDAGRDPSKQINEDAAGYAETACGHLAVVCDGMGGHSAGREASHAAVRTIMEAARGAPAAQPGLVLKQAVEAAGRAVYAVGGNAPPELRPGSTAVAVLLHAGGAEVAHAGDSRVYRVRGANIERLTRDHSMVQQLVDAGMLAADQALSHPDANKITRALGIAPEVNVELRPEPLAFERGDTFLLCTDGLTDLVSDAEIRDVVQRRIASGSAAVCQELVALANSRGGHDNITAVVLNIVEAPAMPFARGGTVVEAPLVRGAGGTLVAERRDKGTLPDSDAPAPTLYDDGTLGPRPTAPGATELEHADRATQPGDAPETVPRFSQDEPPPAFARGPSSGRLLKLLAIAFALTLIGGVLAWAVVSFMHGARHHDGASEDEPVPPPAPPPRRWRHKDLAPLDSGEAPAPPASGQVPPEDGADSGGHSHERGRLLNEPLRRREGNAR